VEDQTYTSTVEDESDNDDDDISEVMEISNKEVSMVCVYFGTNELTGYCTDC